MLQRYWHMLCNSLPKTIHVVNNFTIYITLDFYNKNLSKINEKLYENIFGLFTIQLTFQRGGYA